MATSGPGAMNLLTAIADARADSVPIIAITGQVNTTQIGTDAFQEADTFGLSFPITKHSILVKSPEELLDAIPRAFEIALNGRPGPVLVDIPKDVQQAIWDFEPKPDPVRPYPLSFASEIKLRKAAELINNSKRPYIYFGGGVISGKASAEIIKLADRIDAPLGSSLMGLSAVPADHPRFLGMSGMHGHYASSQAQKEADLVIAMGARFSDRATEIDGERSYRLIHIDIDNAELDKNVISDIAIQGDIKDALYRLLPMLSETSRPEWSERIAQLREKEAELLEGGKHTRLPKNCGGCTVNCGRADMPESEKLAPYDIIDTISSFASENDIIVTDVGQHQMWTAQRYPFKKPRTFLTSGGLGTMGFGLGAAIGASSATGRRTILFTGDGSFGMDLNELATSVSQNTPLVIVVMNNGVLGMVRQMQTLCHGERYSNTTLCRKTDFVKLAEAFGAEGGRAATKEELEKLAERAFACEGPFVIDCAVDCDEFVLPMLPPEGSVDDIITEIK
jgi:acetolactate synthase-1/2/3 large subunit